MKRGAIFVWSLSLCLGAFVPLCLWGEVIDKTAAVVENHVITLSDMQREREIRAGLGEPVLDSKALVSELIDQYLVGTEIADSNIEVTEAEVEATLERSRDRPAPPTEALRDAVRFRLRAAKYFEARFRPTIRPDAEEVRRYYNDLFVPEAEARGLNPVPPLEDVADRIQRNVTEEALKREIDVWIEAVRKRSSIEVFE